MTAKIGTPILVTGGTGTLGRQIVRLLRNAGREVRVLSRRGAPPGDEVDTVVGDLATGQGVDEALVGTEVVVHCAGSAKGDDDKARHLVRAASQVGVAHVVHMSVVGVDRIPLASRTDRAMFGYFGSKLAAEHAVAESGVPWTVLRATQFHDLILKVVQQMGKLPVVPVPAGFRFQPTDSGEVAARLVELALGDPQGLVPEVGGPKVHTMADLFRSYLRATGKRRWLVPVPLPGAAARAFRDGANLAEDKAVGQRTWEDFLSNRLEHPPGSTTPGVFDASGPGGGDRVRSRGAGEAERRAPHPEAGDG